MMKITTLNFNTNYKTPNFKGLRNAEGNTYWGDIIRYANALSHNNNGDTFQKRSHVLKSTDYDVYDSIYKY